MTEDFKQEYMSVFNWLTRCWMFLFCGSMFHVCTM